MQMHLTPGASANAPIPMISLDRRSPSIINRLVSQACCNDLLAVFAESRADPRSGRILGCEKSLATRLLQTLQRRRRRRTSITRRNFFFFFVPFLSLKTPDNDRAITLNYPSRGINCRNWERNSSFVRFIGKASLHFRRQPNEREFREPSLD